MKFVFRTIINPTLTSDSYWIINPEKLSFTEWGKINVQSDEEIEPDISTRDMPERIMRNLIADFENELFDTVEELTYYKLSGDLSVVAPFKILNKE